MSGFVRVPGLPQTWRETKGSGLVPGRAIRHGLHGRLRTTSGDEVAQVPKPAVPTNSGGGKHVVILVRMKGPRRDTDHKYVTILV